jgi:hypothetical protein
MPNWRAHVLEPGTFQYDGMARLLTDCLGRSDARSIMSRKGYYLVRPTSPPRAGFLPVSLVQESFPGVDSVLGRLGDIRPEDMLVKTPTAYRSGSVSVRHAAAAWTSDFEKEVFVRANNAILLERLSAAPRDGLARIESGRHRATVPSARILRSRILDEIVGSTTNLVQGTPLTSRIEAAIVDAIPEDILEAPWAEIWGEETVRSVMDS